MFLLKKPAFEDRFYQNNWLDGVLGDFVDKSEVFGQVQSAAKSKTSTYNSWITWHQNRHQCICSDSLGIFLTSRIIERLPSAKILSSFKSSQIMSQLKPIDPDLRASSQGEIILADISKVKHPK